MTKHDKKTGDAWAACSFETRSELTYCCGLVPWLPFPFVDPEELELFPGVLVVPLSVAVPLLVWLCFLCLR